MPTRLGQRINTRVEKDSGRSPLANFDDRESAAGTKHTLGLAHARSRAEMMQRHQRSHTIDSASPEGDCFLTTAKHLECWIRGAQLIDADLHSIEERHGSVVIDKSSSQVAIPRTNLQHSVPRGKLERGQK